LTRTFGAYNSHFWASAGFMLSKICLITARSSFSSLTSYLTSSFSSLISYLTSSFSSFRSSLEHHFFTIRSSNPFNIYFILSSVRVISFLVLAFSSKTSRTLRLSTNSLKSILNSAFSLICSIPTNASETYL